MTWFIALGLCVRVGVSMCQYIPNLFLLLYLMILFSSLQCFDFHNFIDINSKKPSWRCPSCNQYVCYTDIRLDRNMVEASWLSSLILCHYLLLVFSLLVLIWHHVNIGNGNFGDFFMLISANSPLNL